MPSWIILCCCLWVFLQDAGADAQRKAMRPASLTTEFQQDPVGLGAEHPAFAWTLSPLDSNRAARNLRQTAYRIIVGANAAEHPKRDQITWDSGRVAASAFWQRSYSGPPLRSNTTYFWRVQVWSGDDPRPGPWSSAARFTTAKFHPSDWSAHWIAAEPDHPPSNHPPQLSDTPPLPVFRHVFQLRKKVARAVLSVAGLGQYEVHLNGKNVTHTVLNSGWTDYRKSVPYDTYEVAGLLKPGFNAFGVLLGNGMYNVEDVKGHYTKFAASFGQPKCLLQLDVRYTDGTSTTILSNREWKTHAGPVVYSSIYGGETFDATALAADWDEPAFRPEGWQPALEVAGPGGALVASQSPPMVVAETYPSVRTAMPRLGVTVYDLGATISGWPAITLQGKRGTIVTLLGGELLSSDGTVSQRSINAFPADPVSFRYVLRGGSFESWHPRFSYSSLRYIQVTTSNGEVPPTILSVAGQFVHARAGVAGTFTSSDPLFNRIHTLIGRAVLSNLASVITDCPSREKLGWLEQTYLNASTLMLNFNVTRLYEKMSDDMAEAQLANGLVPSIAPEFVAFVDGNGDSTAFRDSPEWGSAVILAPWALYRHTGDVRILAKNYPAMQRYAAYLQKRSSNGMLNYGLGDWYDIGQGPPGPSQLTSRLVTATGVFYQDLETLARIADLLGEPEEAAAYTRQAAAVRAAFNAALFHPETNQYDRGSQTANAIPLALGLVPRDRVPAVLAHLVADIHAHADHVTSGDIGFHYVVRALTDAGRSDVLAAMFSRTDSPSYGFQLAQGATTLTEAWDANPTSSQNHFMLGHGEEWFYRGLAGLQIDMALPENRAITFQPSFLPGVDHAAASYATPMGQASIAWARDATQASVVVIVPAGAMARIVLPAAGTWRESSGPASPDQILGSGTYLFTSKAWSRDASNARPYQDEPTNASRSRESGPSR